MHVWVLFESAPWLPAERWTLYESFTLAYYDCAWWSIASARRGSVWCVTEAWVTSDAPGEVVGVAKVPAGLCRDPG